jgi:hypothetical protein
MRIFPKFRFADVENLNPQNILAGLLIAVKGQSAKEIELMHLSSNLAGPHSDSFMVEADDLRRLIQSSTRILRRLGLDTFIEQSNQMLTHRQKLAALVTIMDVCMVENSLLDGEKTVFDQVRKAFGISEDELRPYEEMLILKNESSIRLNVMPSSYYRAAEGFRSLV